MTHSATSPVMLAVVPVATGRRMDWPMGWQREAKGLAAAMSSRRAEPQKAANWDLGWATMPEFAMPEAARPRR